MTKICEKLAQSLGHSKFSRNGSAHFACRYLFILIQFTAF